MRRGEQKELEAISGEKLCRNETEQFQNGIGALARGLKAGETPALPLVRTIAARRCLLAGHHGALCLVLVCATCAAGCGGGSPGGSVLSPPPPHGVTVSITPNSATVLLGNTVVFAASVNGASDAAVVWAVNGVPGGNAAMGAISPSGTYQAPAVLPPRIGLQVEATSQADSGSSASAAVTVTSDVRVQVAPPAASVELGARQSFGATISSAGHPSNSVTWSLASSGCTGEACGTIAADGTFMAPGIMPALASVSVIATSVADPSRSAAAAVTLTSTGQPLMISPSNASVALEQMQLFTVTLNGGASQAVIWSVNNIPGGNTSVGTISNSPAQNGLYLAPVNMPVARQVTISATSTANPILSNSAPLQLTSNVLVSITPAMAVRIPGARQTLTASVAQTSNPNVGWTVNGVPNGNAVLGQICLTGTNPCQSPPLSLQPGSIEYLAPATVPAPPQVTVQAVSEADPARFATVTITITPQISVSISPPNLTMPPGQVQTLTPTVLGVADQNVTWDVGGSINGSIPLGLICLLASSPCQAPNGPSAGPVEYRAPDVPPSPNVVSVRATSEASPTVQGTAIITISTAPYVSGLVPASVFAGAAAPFGLRVEGVEFAASQPGPGTTILVNGAARPTNCLTATECTTTLDPADVSAAGTLTVSVQNAGTPPPTGNSVSLIVVAPQRAAGVIVLDASAPLAAGIDILVVEPTLAGSAPPAQVSLLEIGQIDPATGTCNLGAPPLVMPRPASGSATARFCLFGTALDQVAQVTFSSPAAPDLTTANLDTSLGSLTLAFDAVLPAAAAPGPRTLFVTTANLDQAALTAAVEVQ